MNSPPFGLRILTATISFLVPAVLAKSWERRSRLRSSPTPCGLASCLSLSPSSRGGDPS